MTQLYLDQHPTYLSISGVPSEWPSEVQRYISSDPSCQPERVPSGLQQNYLQRFCHSKLRPCLYCVNLWEPGVAGPGVRPWLPWRKTTSCYVCVLSCVAPAESRLLSNHRARIPASTTLSTLRPDCTKSPREGSWLPGLIICMLLTGMYFRWVRE